MKHQEELLALQQQMKENIKKAKKSEKAQVEAQAIQMEFDMKARHREEVDVLEEAMGDLNVSGPASSITSISKANHKDDAAEAAMIQQKRDKAKKKKEKRQMKEVEREEEKAKIISTSGLSKSARDLESEILDVKLLSNNLKIKDIPPDGNCLYHAIADQLSLSNELPHHNIKQLRSIAANHMRANESEYAPFVDDISFDEYCNKVESDVLAEWGGELEIRALSESLGVCIHIYSADAPLLLMNETAASKAILRLSFHRHLFALGEHYNSLHDSL